MTTRTPRQRRDAALAEVARLGFPLPSSLPLGDPADGMITRTVDDVARRACAIAVAAAVTYGFPRDRGYSWVETNGIESYLTPAEVQALSGGVTEALSADLKRQIEAAWALCWALKHVSVLDNAVRCSNEFVHVLPNLKISESIDSFLSASSLRDKEDLVLQQDILFCLHWGLVDARLRGRRIPSKLEPYVVEQRRRAIEWILSDDHWDKVAMDT